MSTEPTGLTPSLEATVYSLRESLKAMHALNMEDERTLMQRVAVAQRTEQALEALLYQLRQVPPPPMGNFPELNRKE